MEFRRFQVQRSTLNLLLRSSTSNLLLQFFNVPPSTLQSCRHRADEVRGPEEDRNQLQSVSQEVAVEEVSLVPRLPSTRTLRPVNRISIYLRARPEVWLGGRKIKEPN